MRFKLVLAFAAAFISSAEHARAATCPVTIQSLSLAGMGAFKHSAMYEVVAVIPSPSPSSMELEFKGAGETTTVDWAAVTPDPKSTPVAATYWLPRESADIRAVRVASVDQTPCSEKFTAVAAASDASTALVSVYDDSKPVDRLRFSVQNGGPQEVTDADFVGKPIPPDYPDRARMQGWVGDFAVGVNIDTDGEVLYAWFISKYTNETSPALEQAALSAARGSHFRPKIVDGRPVVGTYTITYTFDIDGVDYAPFRFACNTHLTEMRISNNDPKSTEHWYMLSLSGDDGSAESAIVDVLDDHGAATAISWPALNLVPNPDGRTWTAYGTFNWMGPPLVRSSIQLVRTSDGKTTQCNPWVMAPDNLEDTTVYPRIIAGEALPQLPIESLEPARFVTEHWPSYPRDPQGVLAAGATSVETVVDHSGTVREAFILRSSGVDALDLAALDAAEASTYEPAPANAVRFYAAMYRFVP